MFDYNIDPPTQMDFDFCIYFYSGDDERYALADESGKIIEFADEKGNFLPPTEEDIAYVKYAVWAEKVFQNHDVLTVMKGDLFVSFITRLRGETIQWEFAGVSNMDPTCAHLFDEDEMPPALNLTDEEIAKIGEEVSAGQDLVIAKYPDYRGFFENYELNDIYTE